jgi:hypothetical protein
VLSVLRVARATDGRQTPAPGAPLAGRFGDDKLRHVGIFAAGCVDLNVGSAHRIPNFGCGTLIQSISGIDRM